MDSIKTIAWLSQALWTLNPASPIISPSNNGYQEYHSSGCFTLYRPVSGESESVCCYCFDSLLWSLYPTDPDSIYR